MEGRPPLKKNSGNLERFMKASPHPSIRIKFPRLFHAREVRKNASRSVLLVASGKAFGASHRSSTLKASRAWRHQIKKKDPAGGCGKIQVRFPEEIRLTSWYGKYVFHYLQGFIHVRWCRISSINSRTNFHGQKNKTWQFFWGGEKKTCLRSRNHF